MILETALAAFDRWWTDEPLLGPPEVIAHINWGTTHQAIRVRGQTASGPADFVIRFLARAEATLALHFDSEFTNLRNASNAGIAPKPVFANADTRMLVTEFIGEYSSSITPKQLAKLITAIHSLPKTEHRLDFHNQLNHYTRVAISKGIPSDTLVDPAFPPLKKAIDTLHNGPLVVCHNDLGIGNVFAEGERVAAIDWEYSAMSNPYFEISTALGGWADIEEDALLDALAMRRFDPIQWRCAKAVQAAIDWNWHQASRVDKPETCTLERTRELLMALP